MLIVLTVPGGASGLCLFPLPGTLTPGKPSLIFFLLSLGATVCCSLQRHTVEKKARGGPAAASLFKGLGVSAEPQIHPLRRTGKKNKKLESVLANAPMQKSKLYSLLFIYLTILKYLLLALTKNEKYRSTLLSLGEKGYIYTAMERYWFLLYIQRKIILLKKVLHRSKKD